MNLYFFLASCLLVLGSHKAVAAWTAVELLEENEEHPGKCYLPGMNKALKPNELWKEVPNICAQVRCTVEEDMEGNAQYKAVFSGCPSYGVVLSPCHLGGRDQSLPYPDCCPALEDCGEFTKEQLMRLKEKQKALKLDLRSNFPKKKSQNPKDKLKKNKK